LPEVSTLLLALVLFLPIPLGNLLPGLAIALIGLGLLEKDGAPILLGMLTGIIGILVVAGVLYGLAGATVFVLHGAFGL
jgi:hypothetical protein